MSESNIAEKSGPFFIGVDVGTGSARACLVNNKGHILSMCEQPIHRQELVQDHITQSSTEIWEKICFCVRHILEKSAVNGQEVRGIGFDATCSLVVVDEVTHEPIAVGPDFLNNDENIMLWMDHRADGETKDINQTHDKCLKYVGGKMSIEMEIPKIKWLKSNVPSSVFNRCKFYDLSDFLTFRATGSQTKSLCAAACKQGFLPHGVEGSTDGWSAAFLENIGLEELIENNFSKLGGPLRPQDSTTSGNYLSPGQYIGTLSENAAKELDLSTDCAVSSGVIDAYAGWIGTVAATSNLDDNITGSAMDAIGRLAIIAGTSTCHITVSKDPIFVDGIWGPYKDVLMKGFWSAEGGQTCTGELLSFILRSHPAYDALTFICKTEDVSPYEYLNSLLGDMAKEKKVDSVLQLVKHIFFYGDLRGNRSPLSDASMRGSVIGITMDTSIEDLALKYLSACEFISLQTRHIISTMTDAGHHISALYISGGQCRNNLLMQLLTNTVGYPVVIPKYIDSAVVLGAAIMGASAYNDKKIEGLHSDNEVLWETMRSMTTSKNVINPLEKSHPDRRLLDVKYEILLKMASSQREYRAMVDSL